VQPGCRHQRIGAGQACRQRPERCGVDDHVPVEVDAGEVLARGVTGVQRTDFGGLGSFEHTNAGDRTCALRGRIGAAVGNDHDLGLPGVELTDEGPEAALDDGLLVVRRDDDREADPAGGGARGARGGLDDRGSLGVLVATDPAMITDGGESYCG
jgi:hypothetical protein